MTVLAAIQNLSSVIGIDKPVAVYGSTEREHFELQVLANKSAEEIAKAYEWQALKALKTMTGDGVTEDFALPEDYLAMLRKTKLWSSSLKTPLGHITSTDEWQELTVRAISTGIGVWTLYGNQIHIKPAPATGVTITYWYRSNKYALEADGITPKAAFVVDGDIFRLSERLLELDMTWRWKAQKGTAYAEALQDYQTELDRLITEDKGSRILRVGRPRIPSDVRVAYPIPIVP